MQVAGIDISKKKFDAAIFRNGKMLCKEFSNCSKGFAQLQIWLNQNGMDKTSVCMEATGFYGESLAEFLYTHGHKVSVVNPSCIKSYGKSKLSRHKTDKVDSKLIAEYAYKQEPPLWKPIASTLKELRQIYRCMEALKRQLTQVKNQLENSTLCVVVKKNWEKLEKQIKKQLKELNDSARQIITKDKAMLEDYKNLQTIPGISETTAIGILAEVPDLSSFQNARQLAAYAGLVPKHRVSGSSLKGASRLSKLGSASLRKCLYLPAIVARKHNPIIALFCQKLLSKGKNKMTIIGAAMRKLIHIIYGVLKNKKAFNPRIDAAL